MTTELKSSKEIPMDATKTVPADAVAFDEEDDFLRELRELAGMDEQTPATPIGAASAGKATAPAAPAPEPVMEQPQEEELVPPAGREEQPLPADDEDSYFFAGWQKGLMLLVGSASILVLTVLAVLNALHI